MKCGSCNAENPAGAKFCHACGVPLAMQHSQMPVPGAQPRSAGVQISPTVIGIVLVLLISVVGAAYVGWTWYEDSSRPGNPVSTVDEKTIEERRKQAERDRLAEERQKALDAEREKQRQLADAQEAMKLAQGKANEDARRAQEAARAAEEQARRAQAKAREDAKAAQDARAQDARAREAKAREEARARELARREAVAREARARQQAQANTAAVRPVEAAAPAPAPAPAQPVAVAQAAPAAAAPAQNDPCAALTGLKREQCTSCNRHTFGPRKAACEDRAMERYCERRWNQPGQQECADPRRR